MKPFLSLLLFTPVAFADPLPADIYKIVDQRAAAIAKIQAIYDAELAKVKIEATKRGDLTTALAISQLMKAAGFSLEGKWTYRWDDGRKFANGKTSITRTFAGNLMIDESDILRPVTITANGATVDFGNWGVEQLKIDPAHPNLIHGTNSAGQNMTYTREN